MVGIQLLRVLQLHLWQPAEGIEGVKVDGEKKKKKKQNGIEEAEVTDTPVASKKTKG